MGKYVVKVLKENKKTTKKSKKQAETEADTKEEVVEQAKVEEIVEQTKDEEAEVEEDFDAQLKKLLGVSEVVAPEPVVNTATVITPTSVPLTTKRKSSEPVGRREQKVTSRRS